MDSSGPLRELLRSVLPSERQLEAAEACLETIRLLVLSLFGDEAAVVVQGSYAQGLALRGSDLDVAIVCNALATSSKRLRAVPCAEDATPDAVDKASARRRLSKLANALSAMESTEVRVAMRIFTARVPVLRLHVGGHGGGLISSDERIVIDVSVAGSLARGACDRSVYGMLARDTTGQSAGLCRLVKLWAKRRALTNTLKGGLSSFAFVLLSIFFMQRFTQLSSVAQVAAAVRKLVPQRRKSGASQVSARLRNASRGLPLPLGLMTVAPGECGRMSPVNEIELVTLLASFFQWAVEDLPGLMKDALSVTTGETELRPKIGLNCPLFLTVPLTPLENAARCLRRDVWDTKVLPELERGHQLTKQLLQKRGARRNVVRELFKSAGTAADDAGGGFHTQISPTDAGRVVQSSRRKRRGLSSNEDDCGADFTSADALDTASGRRATKKAKRRRDQAGMQVTSEAPTSHNNQPSVEEEGSKIAAPVERWLGLRSLLRPPTTKTAPSIHDRQCSA